MISVVGIWFIISRPDSFSSYFITFYCMSNNTIFHLLGKVMLATQPVSKKPRLPTPPAVPLSLMNNQMTNTAPLVLPIEQNGKAVHTATAQALPVRYRLYARKSSEDDERQALSIDSQVKEMEMLAGHLGIIVVETRTESHSAKLSGGRPVFNQLIADIQNGMFDGILTWATDRLSRNAGDLGSVVDLIDAGKLKEIRTHSQAFTNTPNDKFLLMILGSQAKLENDNRGINVKRGMKTKCEMGFRPNMAPLGYINDHYSGKGMKQVFVDKKRAPFIVEAFE